MHEVIPNLHLALKKLMLHKKTSRITTNAIQFIPTTLVFGCYLDFFLKVSNAECAKNRIKINRIRFTRLTRFFDLHTIIWYFQMRTFLQNWICQSLSKKMGLDNYVVWNKIVDNKQTLENDLGDILKSDKWNVTLTKIQNKTFCVYIMVKVLSTMIQSERKELKKLLTR